MDVEIALPATYSQTFQIDVRVAINRTLTVIMPLNGLVTLVIGCECF